LFVCGVGCGKEKVRFARTPHTTPSSGSFNFFKFLKQILVMFKKLILIIVLGMNCLNFSGCIFVAASLRETQKAKQDFNVSYIKALEIVKKALVSLNLKFEEAVIKPDVAVVKGKYTNEKTMYIEIFKISDNESRIAVRVGTSDAGKAEACKILEVIEKYSKENQ